MNEITETPEIKRLAAWMMWFWRHRHEIVIYPDRYGVPSLKWLPQDVRVDAVHAVPFGHYGVSIVWWPMRAILDSKYYPSRNSVWNDARLIISANGIELWKGNIRGVGRWEECNVELWKEGIRTLVQIIDKHASDAKVLPPGHDPESYEDIEQLQRLKEIQEAEEALALRIRRYTGRKEDDVDARS